MSEWFYKKINWFAGYFAIAITFGLIVFLSNIEIKDLDLWLHLASGRHILETLTIPKVDFLSCTIADKPWINHEWLFQAVVYSVYNVFGIDGLITLRAGIIFVTFVMLFFLGYSRERQFVPTAVLLLVLLVYQARMTLRPDIFSLLFFTFYISILGMHLERRWSLAMIFLIQIVWVNVHGFFIFGPILVLVVLAAEWTKRRIVLPFEWNDVGRLSDVEYKRVKWLLLLVVLACFVNPYFARGAWYPLGVLFSLGGESKVFFDKIQELQRPLAWSNLLSMKPYFYYRLMVVFSFVSFMINRRKIDITVLFIWSTFLVFSLLAVRNIVFLAFASYFAILANYQYVSTEAFLPSKCQSIKSRTICSIALKVVLIVWVMNYGNRLLLRGYYDFDKFARKSEFGGLSLRNFPHRAVDFIEEKKIKGNFFNDFNSGAYLLGRVSPEIKAFIDGRTEVYGAEFFRKYRDIWEGDVAVFEEAVQQYGLSGAFLNSVYVPAPEKFIKYLYQSNKWVLVYFDYDAAIFLKDAPENRQWIDRYRIDLTRWQTKEAELLRIGTHKVTPYRYVNRAYALYNMGFPQKAEDEAHEALRIQPYNYEAHKLIGKIYNDRGDYARAFESLRKAKLIEPNDMKLRHQMALSLYHLGEFVKAHEQCMRVLSVSPDNKDALELKILIDRAQEKVDREDR